MMEALIAGLALLGAIVVAFFAALFAIVIFDKIHFKLCKYRKLHEMVVDVNEKLRNRIQKRDDRIQGFHDRIKKATELLSPEDGQ